MKKSFIVCIAALTLLIVPSISHAEYYVKVGDTLTGIAKQQGMTYQDLLSLNPHITNSSMIYPGQYIVIRSANRAQDLIDYARSLQDVTTYVYGGQDAPYKTDCSGWVQYIYSKFGVSLPRMSKDQAKVGSPVAFQQLQMGDLMFFSTRADKVITHVGIYLGNNYWISNLSAKENVDVLSTWGSWTQKYFLWGQRVL